MNPKFFGYSQYVRRIDLSVFSVRGLGNGKCRVSHDSKNDAVEIMSIFVFIPVLPDDYRIGNLLRIFFFFFNCFVENK